METALALSSPNTLLSILNTIIIGVIMYITLNRFSYIVNVIVYAIIKTIIPIMITLIFAGIVGITNTVSIGGILGSILILLIPYFILGLLVIKVVEKIVDWFSSNTIIWFIVAFSIIEFILSWLFVAFLGIFV